MKNEEENMVRRKEQEREKAFLYTKGGVRNKTEYHNSSSVAFANCQMGMNYTPAYHKIYLQPRSE